MSTPLPSARRPRALSCRPYAQRARAGFTLVELMVALTAGAFAIAGAYYLTGTSSRLFNEQMSVTEVQSSLRLAMEQIKRDVSRAGFLATRSRRELFDCSGVGDSVETSPIPIDGFSVAVNSRSTQVTALLNTAQNTVLRTDRLVLNGNYVTSDAYLIDPSYDPASGIIALQPGHDSFVRSFTTGDGAAIPQFQMPRFDAVFTTNRLVRIEHMQSGRVFFRRVTATAPLGTDTGTITLDAPLPVLCFTPSEVAISPVVRVRYQIEAPSDDRAELGLGYEDANADARVSANRTVLVRRELSTALGNEDVPVPGSARVVLDYAVELQVNAWYDLRTHADGTPQDPVAEPPLLTYADDTSTAGSLTVQDLSTNTPHRFRSAVITLAARAPEADDRLPCIARTSLRQPLTTFRVPDPEHPTYRRCARVRSLKSEVYMPNMAFRAGTL
jgi:prepilin-type N-terminal cleavage/methylation domain-containing protein